MSDLVGNPEDRFSRVEAQILSSSSISNHHVFTQCNTNLLRRLSNTCIIGTSLRMKKLSIQISFSYNKEARVCFQNLTIKLRFIWIIMYD